ncbi:MAG TPA: dephospho-CoA kinase [Actinomycetota bacterium]|nr:dephospho-CoA kinase [Actinomycetota bacterium]
MLLVGLTGGIGSGKSTFAALLAERGAQIIDADLIGREALQPGKPAWHSVVDQFGDEVLVPGTMDIDRKRLASIVFQDRPALAALNAIVHPVIFKEIADRLETLKDTDAIVVLDAALLVELGLIDSLDHTIVVVANDAKRVERLISGRGMSRKEIADRMAAQAPVEDLIARADIVVENTGSLEHLAAEAERVYSALKGLN